MGSRSSSTSSAVSRLGSKGANSVDRFEEKDETTIEGFPARRYSLATSNASDLVRSVPASVSSCLISTLTRSGQQASMRLAERGKPRRQLRRQEAAERAKSGHFAVMVDDYVAVGGEVDVQLDPSAPRSRAATNAATVFSLELSRSRWARSRSRHVPPCARVFYRKRPRSQVIDYSKIVIVITCLHRAAGSRRLDTAAR